MNRPIISLPLVLVGILLVPVALAAYPVDGYTLSRISRLLKLERIHNGEMKGRELPAGAYKSISDIYLHLHQTPRGDQLTSLPAIDSQFQRDLEELLPNLHESYSVTLMDITPGRPLRYAAHQPNRAFQPGSVGKLAVITALFRELARIYPESFNERRKLLIRKKVLGGPFAVYDHHTIPIFDPETNRASRRQASQSDVFTLFEWADHMMSVSNNGAASIVWREAMLMRVFGKAYADMTQQQVDSFFRHTSKPDLAELGRGVVNDPLQELGITSDDWRLGLMFTRGASSIVPGKGGSTGSPHGLMKWMVALERGAIVDAPSSLEIKRLMYMTGRRIRYASNRQLDDAAVYFKSGSLYSCGGTGPCGKYRGNRVNYMNSVCIVEHEDGTVYLVTLMTNVLRRNSAYDHNLLAGKIDQLVRANH